MGRPINPNLVQSFNPARLRAARRAAQLTQEKLGDLVGINGETVRKHEAGRVKVPRERLTALSMALNIPPGWFCEPGSAPIPSTARAAARNDPPEPVAPVSAPPPEVKEEAAPAPATAQPVAVALAAGMDDVIVALSEALERETGIANRRAERCETAILAAASSISKALAATRTAAGEFRLSLVGEARESIRSRVLGTPAAPGHDKPAAGLLEAADRIRQESRALYEALEAIITAPARNLQLEEKAPLFKGIEAIITAPVVPPAAAPPVKAPEPAPEDPTSALLAELDQIEASIGDAFDAAASEKDIQQAVASFTGMKGSITRILHLLTTLPAAARRDFGERLNQVAKKVAQEAIRVRVSLKAAPVPAPEPVAVAAPQEAPRAPATVTTPTPVTVKKAPLTVLLVGGPNPPHPDITSSALRQFNLELEWVPNSAEAPRRLESMLSGGPNGRVRGVILITGYISHKNSRMVQTNLDGRPLVYCRNSGATSVRDAAGRLARMVTPA